MTTRKVIVSLSFVLADEVEIGRIQGRQAAALSAKTLVSLQNEGRSDRPVRQAAVKAVGQITNWPHRDRPPDSGGFDPR